MVTFTSPNRQWRRDSSPREARGRSEKVGQDPPYVSGSQEGVSELLFRERVALVLFGTALGDGRALPDGYHL